MEISRVKLQISEQRGYSLFVDSENRGNNYLKIWDFLSIALSDNLGTHYSIHILSMGDCQVIMRKARPWAFLGNVFGECHTPCTLRISFACFENRRIVAATKGLMFRLYPTLHPFFSDIKNRWPTWPIPSLIS